MLKEFIEGRIVIQLAITGDPEVLPDGRMDIFVNDGNGQPTRPLKISQSDFEKQFRPWGGFKNVFIRLLKIVAIENDMIRFQRLDINDKNFGDKQLTKKEFFATDYMLESEISI